MKKFLLPIAFGLVALGSTAVAAGPSAPAWQIGPVIKGDNRSVGMPLQPTATDRGWSFEFPTRRTGHVNYVTTPTGSLAGKSRIVMRYRITAAPDVRLTPRESPGTTAKLALYFQRRGDNWTAKRQFAHYRWYAIGSQRVPLTAGEHVVSLPLDGRNWKSVGSATGAQAPSQFRDALANAAQVGFTFGGGGSAGHGVYATGPARFELISFEVT